MIKDVKQTELSAENMIEDAEKKAKAIINKAADKVEELKKSIKEQAIREGEILIIGDEKNAKEESDNIYKNCNNEKEYLKRNASGKIEKAVKYITEKIIEGL